MRYGRYMIINVRCNWPHKINALFAINAIVSIRTRDFLRSISLDLVPLRPNRRRAAFRKETRTLNHRTRFWSLRFTFRRSAVITTNANLSKSRSVSVVFVYQLRPSLSLSDQRLLLRSLHERTYTSICGPQCSLAFYLSLFCTGQIKLNWSSCRHKEYLTDATMARPTDKFSAFSYVGVYDIIEFYIIHDHCYSFSIKFRIIDSHFVW